MPMTVMMRLFVFKPLNITLTGDFAQACIIEGWMDTNFSYDGQRRRV
jgi:hypothetical protein